MVQAQIGEEVRSFLLGTDTFRELIGDAGIDRATPLLEQGILDSIGIFELVGFLETRFQIRLSSQDIVESHFRDLASIESFVARKLPGA